MNLFLHSPLVRVHFFLWVFHTPLCGRIRASPVNCSTGLGLGVKSQLFIWPLQNCRKGRFFPIVVWFELVRYCQLYSVLPVHHCPCLGQCDSHSWTVSSVCSLDGSSVEAVAASFLTYLGSTKEIQGTHHCVIPQAQDTPCPAYLLFATLGVFPEWCSHYTGFFIHKGEARWEVELLHLRQRKANAV